MGKTMATKQDRDFDGEEVNLHFDKNKENCLLTKIIQLSVSGGAPPPANISTGDKGPVGTVGVTGDSGPKGSTDICGVTKDAKSKQPYHYNEIGARVDIINRFVSSFCGLTMGKFYYNASDEYPKIMGSKAGGYGCVGACGCKGPDHRPLYVNIDYHSVTDMRKFLEIASHDLDNNKLSSTWKIFMIPKADKSQCPSDDKWIDDVVKHNYEYHHFATSDIPSYLFQYIIVVPNLDIDKIIDVLTNDYGFEDSATSDISGSRPQ